ncbi:hypothetical protein CCM_04333 [Cordyceps militaris CM01]|uniref:Uncharacterized protein n=1 Tax=Cordyceps militaris (strain CM01) TaxID=983644 RepID=G3JEE8_CORMM|nr:uncharacterized protein CCM_04333 [Cordyceps militaris CM01]EGX92961.1 hypothetical protein CCM_04333 [Cordyceps militaris CM01]
MCHLWTIRVGAPKVARRSDPGQDRTIFPVVALQLHLVTTSNRSVSYGSHAGTRGHADTDAEAIKMTAQARQKRVYADAGGLSIVHTRPPLWDLIFLFDTRVRRQAGPRRMDNATAGTAWGGGWQQQRAACKTCHTQSMHVHVKKTQRSSKKTMQQIPAAEESFLSEVASPLQLVHLHHDLRSIGMLDSYITTCIVRQRLASLALYRTCAYVHTSTAVVQPEGGAARYKSVLDIAGSFERAHRLALLPLHSSAGRFKMNREERAEYFLI